MSENLIFSKNFLTNSSLAVTIIVSNKEFFSGKELINFTNGYLFVFILLNFRI